jgi:hypothetical protein
MDPFTQIKKELIEDIVGIDNIFLSNAITIFLILAFLLFLIYMIRIFFLISKENRDLENSHNKFEKTWIELFKNKKTYGKN